MSKVIKLKQEDIEKIVSNVINEQSKKIKEEEVDEQGEPMNYEIGGGPYDKSDHLDIFLGKGEDGEIYVVNAKTGDILGHKKF